MFERMTYRIVGLERKTLKLATQEKLDYFVEDIFVKFLGCFQVLLPWCVKVSFEV